MAPLLEGPTYPPWAQPLSFPTADVAAAAAECRSMARLITDKMSLASTAASAARTNWRGVYADDFGIAWPDTELSASELVERLNRLAGQLEGAIATVAEENTRREGLRSDLDYQRKHPRGPI
jgi:uncharacterized protein YukE